MQSSKVLVVEDNPELRDLVAEILIDEGYVVQTADDGVAALEVVARQEPDVIILDMRLPRMNGWEFSEALRARGVDIPIVVLTAAQNSQQWAAEVGAVGFVAKPFDIDVLARTVRSVRQPCA
jgi:two-component system response regulator MprA